MHTKNHSDYLEIRGDSDNVGELAPLFHGLILPTASSHEWTFTYPPLFVTFLPRVGLDLARHPRFLIMSRSLRKLKKTKAKVKVGVVKRSKKTKAPVPQEISSSRPDIAAKLQQSIQWSKEKTPTSNYQENGFMNDPNKEFSKFGKVAAEDNDKEDDDMRSAFGVPSISGRRLPDPLTSKQREVIARLIEKHSNDVACMVVDRRLNKMLLPASQLTRMIEAFNLHPAGSRVPFQQPKKKLW